ncbi:MAG TPA: branched-chain amino acid ABC transporter permease [Rhizomicrobium sp.]|nr:branched-chain amino acid ABC transporter permease [Rhizomicrobium sp.]
MAVLWVETVINGILLGALFALFGIGLAFAFGIMRIVNAAHGEMIVLSAYVAAMLLQGIHVNAFVMIVPVAAIMFVLGYVLQAVILNRVLGNDPIPALMVTFGLSIILRNLMLEFFGADPRSINAGPIQLLGINVFGISIGVLPLLVLAIVVVLLVVFRRFIRVSGLGRTLRATADDFQIVQIFGVNYRRMYCIAMGIAVALSSVAGLMIAMRTTYSPFTGVDRLLLAFEVVIIGGLGSLWWMLLGGFILGIAELVSLQINPNAGLLYAHLVFFVVLMVMPSGLSNWRRVA